VLEASYVDFLKLTCEKIIHKLRNIEKTAFLLILEASPTYEMGII